MPRRLTAAVAALSLSLLALTACGEDSGEATTALDSVTIEAEAGKAPEVTWDGKLEPEKTETKVLVTGDGEKTAEGDNVLTHIWLGNGFTQEQSFSSYDSGSPELLTIGDNLTKGIRASIEGFPVGSVVAAAVPAEDAFGEAGNSTLGIGNGDSVLFVMELVEIVPNEPQGTEQTPAAWAPALVEEDGLITGFDFTDTPKPTGKLQVTNLIEGDGAVVEEGQTIYVNYLGQVYKAKAPFDDSYSRGVPAGFAIGVGQVVKGWDEALVGQTVGSRVVMAIPPKLGYGAEGNADAGIKGTDTLFFVVDILAAD